MPGGARASSGGASVCVAIQRPSRLYCEPVLGAQSVGRACDPSRVGACPRSRHAGRRKPCTCRSRFEELRRLPTSSPSKDRLQDFEAACREWEVGRTNDSHWNQESARRSTRRGHGACVPVNVQEAAALRAECLPSIDRQANALAFRQRRSLLTSSRDGREKKTQIGHRCQGRRSCVGERHRSMPICAGSDSSRIGDSQTGSLRRFAKPVYEPISVDCCDGVLKQ